MWLQVFVLLLLRSWFQPGLIVGTTVTIILVVDVGQPAEPDRNLGVLFRDRLNIDMNHTSAFSGASRMCSFVSVEGSSGYLPPHSVGHVCSAGLAFSLRGIFSLARFRTVCESRGCAVSPYCRHMPRAKLSELSLCSSGPGFRAEGRSRSRRQNSSR